MAGGMLLTLLLKVLYRIVQAVVIGVLAVPVLLFGLVSYARDLSFKPGPQVDKIRPGKIKRIAIIGGGASGITAAKEALEHGFEPTVFEQTDQVGGNWVFREGEAHASVYRSTVINTSKQFMTYSDFLMPDDCPTFPNHVEIVKYFNSYVDHFGVRPTIKFNTQVLKVDSQDNGTSWQVTYRPSTDGKPLYLMKEASTAEGKTETFDAAMVCNGHHSVPRMPPAFPGQENFKGSITHSHSYKDPHSGYDYTNKNVIVVGIGNSGVDLANELSRVSNKVYLSTRTGGWIFPKYFLGYALDHLSSPRWMLMAIPQVAWTTLLSFMAKVTVWLSFGTMESWGISPGSVGPMQTHITVSQELLHRVGTGAVVMKRNIMKINPTSVTFEDNTTVPADAIIFCTGYRIEIPFLDRQFVDVNSDNGIRLYKNIWPLSPQLANPPTLAVVGMVQPLGSIMPISEIQSRWICAVWKGSVALPSREEMVEYVNTYLQKLAARYLNRSRHTIQVDGVPYMEEIAAEIGCRPILSQNLDLFKELLFITVMSPQYRLNGPGAKPDIARAALRRIYREVMITRPEIYTPSQ